MSINQTKLSTIISRMNRFTVCSQVNEEYKVRDLDEALRALKRNTNMPWTLQHSTLRVFQNVKEYPVADDHESLAYLDNNGQYYAAKAHYRYTSIRQFYEDPTNDNEIAEVWDGNVRYLGVNYKNFDIGSILLDNMELASNWTASGDASNVQLDNVIFKEGNGSIRFDVTNSTGIATMKGVVNCNDGRYKRKYHFFSVYLDHIPTSITLKLEVDAANYLETTVTSQFSGQSFKTGQWNTVAMDLNTATVTGTIPSSPTFTYEYLTLNGAATGTYFLDASYLREWELHEYWYYSSYQVSTISSTTANKEYFYDNITDTYSVDSSIVGDLEWADVIMYDAMLTEMADLKEDGVKADIKEKRNLAWVSLMSKYPTLEYLITENNWIFDNDPLIKSLNYYYVAN